MGVHINGPENVLHFQFFIVKILFFLNCKFSSVIALN